MLFGRRHRRIKRIAVVIIIKMNHLPGNVDNESLDCFVITLLVVIGMNILGFTNSTLTLSEDHAYVSHQLFNNVVQLVLAVWNIVTVLPVRWPYQAIPKIYSLNVVKKYHSHLPNQRMVYQLIIHGYTCLRIQYCVTSHCMILMAMIANMNCDIDKQKPKTMGSSSTKVLLISRAL